MVSHYSILLPVLTDKLHAAGNLIYENPFRIRCCQVMQLRMFWKRATVMCKTQWSDPQWEKVCVRKKKVWKPNFDTEKEKDGNGKSKHHPSCHDSWGKLSHQSSSKSTVCTASLHFHSLYWSPPPVCLSGLSKWHHYFKFFPLRNNKS